MAAHEKHTLYAAAQNIDTSHGMSKESMHFYQIHRHTCDVTV